MDRRKALKNIALSFGCVVATPTLVNILTSCTNQNEVNKYLFLSHKEAEMVQRLIENILPRAHFPLVENMNLTVFLDQLFFYTEDEKDKENFKLGYTEFAELFLLNKNKKLDSISEEKFTTVFKKYFNPEKETAVFTFIDENNKNINNNKKADFSIYTFLTKVRYYSLFGYCTSEAFINETEY